MPMSDYESRVFWFIIRKTYGWQKKSDWISLSQICKGTGMAKPNASRTIKKLIKKNMIERFARQISIQKNYDEWLVPLKPLKGAAKLSKEITKKKK